MFRWLTATTLVFALACGVLEGPGQCTAYAEPALTVSVVDSVSGEPVTGPETRVWAIDGDYVREVHGTDGQFSGVWGRAGRYTVRVESPGYEPWERLGVRVESGDCHVETVHLTARLAPRE